MKCQQKNRKAKCFVDSNGHSPLNFIISSTVLVRDVIDSRQVDKSTFSICQLNLIEWLDIESK